MLHLEIQQRCRLSEHLRENRIPLKMSCGGHGSCRTCRVILDGEPVLACQTEIDAGGYDVSVPATAASSANIQLDLDGMEEAVRSPDPRWHTCTVKVPGAELQPGRSNRERLESVLEPGCRIDTEFFNGLSSEAIDGDLDLGCYDRIARCITTGDKPGKWYAIAVDVGTTTLAAALIDLHGNRLVSCRGRLNGQYLYAEDLVARIAFCRTPELLEEMRELVLARSLRPLLRNMLKEAAVSPEQVLNTVISGNAPMIHILLGLDPTGMGGWPFNGVEYAPPPRFAAKLRLPGEQIEFIPARSAYFGGDIVSGLSFVDFANAPDGALFVDLGTNAEMALKANGKILCTAVPAGPSFEGGGFPCGVSAIPGAIDHVWEEGDALSFSTIGNAPPAGVCGSGIISFTAAAFRAGILRKKGRYARRHAVVEDRELLGEMQRVYPLTDDVYISEDDISNFLQAKAAVFSGIITLCRIAGIDVFDVTRLFLAGNFGKRVNVTDIVDIGIIPPLPAEHISVCGNTSLKGAVQASANHGARTRIDTMIRRLEFVDLNAQPTFQDDFINALFLPHLKLDFTRPVAAFPETAS